MEEAAVESQVLIPRRLRQDAPSLLLPPSPVIMLRIKRHAESFRREGHGTCSSVPRPLVFLVFLATSAAAPVTATTGLTYHYYILLRYIYSYLCSTMLHVA